MAIDKNPVDHWTPVHFTSGLIAQQAGLGLGWTAVLAVAWEIAENANRPKKVIPHMSPDSNVNALVDILATLAGWYASRLLRKP